MQTLNENQLELVVKLLDQYLDETPDLDQREWAIGQSTLDYFQDRLEEWDGELL